MSAHICLQVFIALLIASMVMQWIRARKRRKLVRMVEPASLPDVDQARWRAIGSSFDFMFRDFRKLQIVKRHAAALGNEIRARLARYKLFSRAEITVTVAMLLSGAFAFLVCR